MFFPLFLPVRGQHNIVRSKQIYSYTIAVFRFFRLLLLLQSSSPTSSTFFVLFVVVVGGSICSVIVLRLSLEPVLFTLTSSPLAVLYYVVIVVWGGGLTFSGRTTCPSPKLLNVPETCSQQTSLEAVSGTDPLHVSFLLILLHQCVYT